MLTYLKYTTGLFNIVLKVPNFSFPFPCFSHHIYFCKKLNKNSWVREKATYDRSVNFISLNIPIRGYDRMTTD